jgi:hypothetical protein
MGRVTELRVRADWGFIRFAYLPLLVAGLAVARFLPWVAVVTVRAAPCAICYLLVRWGNHIEESIGCKPILQITQNGLAYEDGGELIEYGWGEITGVVMHRRNNIPPWRTDGSTEIAPPYWLAISVRDPDFKVDDGAVYKEGDSYAERSRRPDGGREIDTEGLRVITIWPRQVVGGLFSLMRFARELQGRLLEICAQGTIPCLIPPAEEAAQ